ncbi:hypothetical protein PINS_up024490 [Pythium insidiosum]|nr:hypothetical protein PINS_up024490 [Pythium insidiosum]
MVDGEGGGDDELPKLYETDSELAERGEDADLDQTLVYESDFVERKAKIEASATTAYVYSVVTADSPPPQGPRFSSCCATASVPELTLDLKQSSSVRRVSTCQQCARTRA